MSQEQQVFGWESVIGQNQLTDNLQNALKFNKISHAYMIQGEKLSGKRMIADIFARALQCESEGERPCNQCRSCKQAMNGNHPDIIYVEHDKPNVISVDNIRTQINGDIAIKPYSGPHKIYIMDEAEKMNKAAQNALLKTIEEPPHYAIIFLLTTNAAGFLPTILSRCVTLELKPISADIIRKELMEHHNMPDYQADVCAQFAQGNLGKAIKLASSEEFNEMKSHMTSLMRRMEKMDVFGISQAVKELEEYKPKIGDYLDLMNIWFRDVLLYKATGDERKITFQDEKMIIKRQASECSYHGLNTIIQAENTARRRIACNGNYNLAVELMLLSIKENIA